MIGVIHAASFLQTNTERTLFAGEAICQGGYELFSNTMHWHQAGLERAVDAMLDARVEGVLLEGLPLSVGTSKALERLVRSKIPLVAMGGVKLPGISHVGADYFQGCYLLTEHLWSLGYRRISMIAPCMAPGVLTMNWSIERRVSGFLEFGARQGGNKARFDVVHLFPSKESTYSPLGSCEQAKMGMRQILQREERPDAVVCSNDELALASMHACFEVGVRVPDDIAVTGFDNSTVAEYVWPPLTSVSQPAEAIAKKAVELLLRKVRGEKLSSAEQEILLPCHLAIRDSCGAKRRSPRSALAPKNTDLPVEEECACVGS
jgi:LacI family transcriptional regulator